MTNVDTLVAFNLRKTTKKGKIKTQPLYLGFSNVVGFNNKVADGINKTFNYDLTRSEAVFEIVSSVSELHPDRIGVAFQPPEGIKHTITFVDFEVQSVSLLDPETADLKVEFTFDEFVEQFGDN